MKSNVAGASSLCVEGDPHSPVEFPHLKGHIPTCAGQPSDCVNCTVGSSDHSHAHGATELESACQIDKVGLSPRAQGIPHNAVTQKRPPLQPKGGETGTWALAMVRESVEVNRGEDRVHRADGQAGGGL